MSDVYELATIADLLKIPPDKLSECLRDIEYAINLCHFAGGDEAARMSFDAFTWTDDGKHSVNMAMNGEPFLSLDVTDSAPVQASEARGDWVLVPRELGADAMRLLADFDMESVGNGRGDAACELWGELVAMAAKPAPVLKFSNPVFHAGTNTTVRRGMKWHGIDFATLPIEGGSIVVQLSTITHPFHRLTDHWLRDEHDPACRTVAGLLAEMQRVYPGFKDTEQVTLVNFDLPTSPRRLSAHTQAGPVD